MYCWPGLGPTDNFDEEWPAAAVVQSVGAQLLKARGRGRTDGLSVLSPFVRRREERDGRSRPTDTYGRLVKFLETDPCSQLAAWPAARSARSSSPPVLTYVRAKAVRRTENQNVSEWLNGKIESAPRLETPLKRNYPHRYVL